MKKTKFIRRLEARAAGDADICPRCYKRDKIVHRPGAKMAKHYRIKHPGKKLPDKFYVGPRDFMGHPIPEYAGRFPVGTRVKVVGFEVMAKKCVALVRKGRRKGQVCGATRDTPELMRRHYKKKHPSAPDPEYRLFDFHRDVQHEAELEGLEIGFKGTVWGITPENYGGKTPALLHVRLDEGIPIHASGKGKKRQVYYERTAMTVLEREVKKLVRK